MTTFGKESRAILKTSMGDVALEFFADRAPRTCEHFVKLARQGFYDGLTFHRILKGFVVQGGCPKGDGSGGPGFTLRAEFNETPHVKGTVSMARGADPHSAGSQFFVCCGEARYLDHRYTAFARVAEGLDVVDKIASVPVTENRWKELSTPREPVFINRIVLEGIELDAEEPGPQASAPAPRAPQSPAAPPAGEAEGDEDDDDGHDDAEGLDDDADEPAPEARDEDDESPVTPPSGAEDEGDDAGEGGEPGAPPAAPGQAGRKRGRRRGGRRRRKD
jgi:peptidyl-prolyl cis-trans isomerase B (cyclophilin B)